jgi:hypothetical protein
MVMQTRFIVTVLYTVLLFESLSYVHPVFNIETPIIARLLRHNSNSLYASVG